MSYKLTLPSYELITDISYQSLLGPRREAVLEIDNGSSSHDTIFGRINSSYRLHEVDCIQVSASDAFLASQSRLQQQSAKREAYQGQNSLRSLDMSSSGRSDGSITTRVSKAVLAPSRVATGSDPIDAEQLLLLDFVLKDMSEELPLSSSIFDSLSLDTIQKDAYFFRQIQCTQRVELNGTDAVGIAHVMSESTQGTPSTIHQNTQYTQKGKQKASSDDLMSVLNKISNEWEVSSLPLSSDPKPVLQQGEVMVAPISPPDDKQTRVLFSDLWMSEVDQRESEELELKFPSNLPSLPVNDVPVSTTGSAQRSSWAITTSLPHTLFEALRPHLAFTFPFELDHFQKQAVMRLERGESVFIAAHTSAGKTVVAEYAIALAQKSGARAIYTSPIKALSNQKYRDFRETFGAANVGLLTGDVSVNPDATCLVMTTEILRSMLYRGSDAVRDVQCVIFDEVHYVNDSERGVVWEEVIIMLPARVRMVFLSATTPNTKEFCDWIGRTKGRQVFVTGTTKRPVPLQHFLLHGDGCYKLMQGDSGFMAHAVAAAAKAERLRSMPKVATAENAGMKAQRAGEKSAIAAQNRGGPPSKTKSGGAGFGTSTGVGNKSASAATTGKKHDVGGTKAQWLSLLRVLRAGGREEAGGTPAIDFGDAVRCPAFITEKARREERSEFVSYDRLPAEMRAQISKREYNATQIRHEGQGELGSDDGSLLPVVVFCFSKKKCEEICDFFSGQDLLTAAQKGRVRMAFEAVRRRLSNVDSRLPQVLCVEERAKRGTGVHHSGLLPLLKECVEVLFAQGLVKVLIATETFAMGVNMPARSVVFNSFRKHDGQGFRDLLPGEYTQMAGRAGRRGIDSVGTVILAAWDEVPGEQTLQKLLTGQAAKLSSQFRLTYGMILNLLRSADMNVEDMIKRSFSEFHTQRALSGIDLKGHTLHAEQALKLEQARAKEIELHEGIIFARFDRAEMAVAEHTFRAARQNLQNSLFFLESNHNAQWGAVLTPGRVAWALGDDLRWDLAPVPIVLLTSPAIWPAGKSYSGLGAARQQLLNGSTAASIAKTQASPCWVWSLVLLPEGCDVVPPVPTPPTNSEAGDVAPFAAEGWESKSGIIGSHVWWLVCLPLTSIGVLSDLVIPLPPVASKPLLSLKTSTAAPPCSPLLNPGVLEEQASALYAAVASLQPLLSESDIPAVGALDLVADCKISSFEFVSMTSDLNRHWGSLIAPLAATFWNKQLRSAYKTQRNQAELAQRVTSLELLASSRSLSLFPDFRQRLSVLQAMGYADDKEAILLKGRAACEMNTCNEVLATEIIFANVLEPLNPPEAAALLSGLVCQEKNLEIRRLTPRMEDACFHTNELLTGVLEIQEQRGVACDEETRPTLNFGLAAVVYQWARGVPFATLMEITSAPEGSIVRCISRLDELLKDFRNAARVLGSPMLYRKMEAASQCIRRDVVFAASLYVD